MAGKMAWLASYPRSGNTWMRLMLRSLHLEGAEPDINGNEGPSSPIASRWDLECAGGLQASLLTWDELAELRPYVYRMHAERSDEPLLLRKVHDSCWMTPQGKRAFPPEISLGAVYLVRDPRDVAVSLAHFWNTNIDHVIGHMGNIKSTMAAGRQGGQLPQLTSTWSHHFKSWVDDSEMPVLVVRYEDTLADAAGQLRRVAKFLQVSDDHVEAAADATSFSRMTQQESSSGFREKPPKIDRFFREGKSGSGKRTLTPKQLETIENDHREVMERLGYL